MFRFTGSVKSVWDFNRQIAHQFVEGVFETEDEDVAEFLRGYPGLSEQAPAKQKAPEEPAKRNRHKRKEED